MNSDEQVAFTYLCKIETGDVEYEPNGGDTFPDFSLGTRIGVEVSRLDQIRSLDGISPDLETTARAFLEDFRQILRSFDSVFEGISYFVGVSFSRTSERVGRRNVNTCIRDKLKEFSESHRAVSCAYNR